MKQQELIRSILGFIGDLVCEDLSDHEIMLLGSIQVELLGLDRNICQRLEQVEQDSLKITVYSESWDDGF